MQMNDHVCVRIKFYLQKQARFGPQVCSFQISGLNPSYYHWGIWDLEANAKVGFDYVKQLLKVWLKMRIYFSRDYGFLKNKWLS